MVLAVEGAEPHAAGIDRRGLGSRPERKGPRRGVADLRRVVEDSPHPLVRREGLSLLDADGREIAAKLGVDEVDRLALDHLVDLLVEGRVVGVDGVEDPSGAGDELHRRRSVGLGQRVDPEALGPHLASRVGLAVLQKAPQRKHVDHRGRPRHEVPLGDLALVGLGHDQVLAALAAVGPRRTHVDHESEERVVDRAGSGPRRNLHDDRPVLADVEHADRVARVGVSGQEEAVGIHQVAEEQDLVAAVDADLHHSATDGLDGRRGDEVEEGLDGPHAVEVVVDRVDRRLVGHAVEEAHGADRGLGLVGGEDLRRHPMVESRGRIRRRGVAGMGKGGRGRWKKHREEDRRVPNAHGVHPVDAGRLDVERSTRRRAAAEQKMPARRSPQC